MINSLIQSVPFSADVAGACAASYKKRESWSYAMGRGAFVPLQLNGSCIWIYDSNLASVKSKWTLESRFRTTREYDIGGTIVPILLLPIPHSTFSLPYFPCPHSCPAHLPKSGGGPPILLTIVPCCMHCETPFYNSGNKSYCQEIPAWNWTIGCCTKCPS